MEIARLKKGSKTGMPVCVYEMNITVNSTSLIIKDLMLRNKQLKGLECKEIISFHTVQNPWINNYAYHCPQKTWDSSLKYWISTYCVVVSFTPHQ